MIYASEHYLLIGLYSLAMVLVIYNSWKILFRQERYKTLPLLFFYIFSFFSIALRWVYIIISFVDNEFVVTFIMDMYLTVKIASGLL